MRGWCLKRWGYGWSRRRDGTLHDRRHEPGHEEVIDAFRQWSACESRLAVNKERMGLNRNTQEALVRALLLRAAVVVHLEDDTVPSPDALRYFEWANERFRNDADTFAVCSYRKTGRAEGLIPANAGRVIRKPDEFFPSGWATWRVIRQTTRG